MDATLAEAAETFNGNDQRVDRLVRRFHLCSGEKHADSDRALPTGVCLLSISPPPGEGLGIIERRYCHVNPFRTDFVMDKQRRATTRGERV